MLMKLNDIIFFSDISMCEMGGDGTRIGRWAVGRQTLDAGFFAPQRRMAIGRLYIRCILHCNIANN